MLEEISKNQFLSGMLITGMLGGIIMYGKGLVMFIYEQIRRRIIFSVTIEEKQHTLYDSINNYLYIECNKQFRNVLAKTFKGKVIYVQHLDSYYVKHKGSWIKISKNREKLEGANDIHQSHLDSFTITSFNRSKLMSLIEHIYDIEQKRKHDDVTPNIYINAHYDSIKHLKENSSPGMQSVILDEILKNDIKTDIEEWLSSEMWYRERGIKYKRGYCLHGEPGNGKTSLIAALAKDYKLDIYYISAGSLLSDEQIRGIISRIPEGNGVIVIEDIDSLFKLRENLIEGSKLTFSGFINSLDGLVDSDSKLLIITTNKLDYLDPALIRPGRIDKMYELRKPDLVLINAYIRRFFGLDYDPVNTYNKILSFAELQNLCIINKDNINTLLECLKD